MHLESFKKDNHNYEINYKSQYPNRATTEKGIHSRIQQSFIYNTTIVKNKIEEYTYIEIL